MSDLNEAIPRRLSGTYHYQEQNQKYPARNKDVYGTAFAHTWTESRSGWRNPAWRSQVAHLQNATTAYSRAGRINHTVGSLWIFLQMDEFYGTPGTYYGERFETSYGELPSSPVQSSKAYNTALGNFLVNINNALSPFKGMVFLGELRETLKMLRRPASSLRNGFSAYLKRARSEALKGRRHRPSARNASRSIADMWLEYAYGWKPLLGDIGSAATAYRQFADRQGVSFVKGSASEDTISSVTTGAGVLHGNYMYAAWTDQQVGSDKVLFKGAVKHTYGGILPDAAQRVVELSGFRLEEFIPTIWELIPYSFVVDYFTNIGDILNSVPALYADLAWKSCSRWTTCSRTIEKRVDRDTIIRLLGPKAQVTSNGRKAEFTRTDYSRVDPSLSIPGIVLHLPSSPWKWVNLGALMASKVF